MWRSGPRFEEWVWEYICKCHSAFLYPIGSGILGISHYSWPAIFHPKGINKFLRVASPCQGLCHIHLTRFKALETGSVAASPVQQRRCRKETRMKCKGRHSIQARHQAWEVRASPSPHGGSLPQSWSSARWGPTSQRKTLSFHLSLKSTPGYH